MPTYNYAFGGGQDAQTGYGDRWVVCFSGTWAFNDFWKVMMTSTQGDYALGVGAFAALTPTVCFTYRDREYLGMGSQVNFSDNGDPTGWEVQNAGAGFLQYLSQFGGQDTVEALNQLQGRLAIFATNSIQIWIVDADPAQFSLAQTLDNIGTSAPLSVQNLGDLDVIFLDDTGYRSLRSKEVTLNAYVDDVGTPVDKLVRIDLLSVSASTAVGIVEPSTKNYWNYLNGKIYVLSRHLSSKITAWALYEPTALIGSKMTNAVTFSSGTMAVVGFEPGTVYKFIKGNATGFTMHSLTLSASGYFVATDTDGLVAGPNGVDWTGSFQTQTEFVPVKFVNFLKRTYCRTTDNNLLLYGGDDNDTYDNVVVTVETPFLDDKTPATNKQGQGIDFALAGKWTVSASMNPHSVALTTIIAIGDGSNPAEDMDSSYDIGRIGYEAIGTHFKLLAVSDNVTDQIAILSALVFHYNKANVL